MDDIISAVADHMPPMNEFLLRGYTRKELDKAVSYIDTTFREGTKLFRGAVTYEGYRILSPEQRAEFEFRERERYGISIAVSELQLVEFEFTHAGKKRYTHLYVPYLKGDVMVIKDRRYAIQRGIAEQVFGRVADGLTVRVIRAPLTFTRDRLFTLTSAVTGLTHREFVVMAGLWHKATRSKRVVETTVIHYLMARFGFLGMLQRVGVSHDDVSFTEFVGTDTEEFDYYLAKKPGRVQDVHLRVRKAAFAENPLIRKLVANILFTLTRFSRHTVANLYEAEGSTFRVMMGRILFGETISEAGARTNVDAHLFSTDLFLDDISKKRFLRFGVNVSDIWALLVYVFSEIDRILVVSTPQNLYNKRIDILDGVFIRPVVTTINRRFYHAEQNVHRLTDREVGRMLRIPPMLITNIYSSEQIITAPAIYNGNWLTSCGIQKIRTGVQTMKKPNPAAAESRFDPSIAVVETLVAFSGQSPGVGGNINPHLPITEDGGIIVPPYAQEIEALRPFLPYH